jgi:hypothetical protein
VCKWLDSIELSEYKDAFKAQAIEGESLVALEKDDFTQLGVKLGHQKKLISNLKALQGLS